MLSAKWLMESIEDGKGISELKVSSSRAVTIVLIALSRRRLVALKSQSALSRMVDRLSVRCSIDLTEKFGVWIVMWVSDDGRRLRYAWMKQWRRSNHCIKER